MIVDWIGLEAVWLLKLGELHRIALALERDHILKTAGAFVVADGGEKPLGNRNLDNVKRRFAGDAVHLGVHEFRPSTALTGSSIGKTMVAVYSSDKEWLGWRRFSCPNAFSLKIWRKCWHCSSFKKKVTTCLKQPRSSSYLFCQCKLVRSKYRLNLPIPF